jgi:hypothetical protein
MTAVLSDESLGAIKGTTPGGVVHDLKDAAREYEHTEEEPGTQETSATRLITPKERKALELKLHRLFVWVGVLTPFEFELGGKKVPLHEIIWDLLAKDCLTEDEKEYVRKLIYKLQAHEKVDEKVLHNNRLTVEDAEEVFSEASGLLRAILDLKSLVGQKDVCTIKDSSNKRRLADAQYWLGFLKQIS